MICEQLWEQEENRILLPSQADGLPAFGTWLVRVFPLSLCPTISWLLQLSRQEDLQIPSSVSRTASALVLVGLPLHVSFMNQIPHKGGGSWVLICHLLGECTQLLGGCPAVMRNPPFVWGMAWTSNWSLEERGVYSSPLALIFLTCGPPVWCAWRLYPSLQVPNS